MGLPRPFEVLNVFGGKSKSNALKAFKFGTKRVPIEVNNWWKFGADISNHFWEIQNLTFFHSNSFPLAYKNSFWKLFLHDKGKELEWKNVKFRISQTWFEISIPNFYQLKITIGDNFWQNLKALGVLKFEFPAKTFWNWNGRGGLNFWAMPSKFCKNA